MLLSSSMVPLFSVWLTCIHTICCFTMQVLLRQFQIQTLYMQHSPAAMFWYYHGVLHPLQYSYTTLSQCGWPTLTVPVLLPSQCSIPPPLPSLSVETTSLPVQAHQSVISMCGVSLLSILLVVVSLLTVLHLSQYLQVCSFWQHLLTLYIYYHISSSRWYIQFIVYKQFTASITKGSIFNTCFCL